MSKISLDARIVGFLRGAVENAPVPSRLDLGSLMTEEAYVARREWFRERDWILNEFKKQADTGNCWWSDHEYEWFLWRVLDFLEGK